MQRLRSASEQREMGTEELRGLGPAPPRRLGAVRRRRCRFGSSGPGCAARHHWDGAARGTSSHLTLPQVALAASPAGEQSPSPAGSPSGNSLGCERSRAAAHGGTGARGWLAGTGRAAGPSWCQVLPAAPPASTWQVPVPICGAHASPASAAARCQPRQMLPAASAGGAATWPRCLTGSCSPAPPGRLSHLQGCLGASRFSLGFKEYLLLKNVSVISWLGLIRNYVPQPFNCENAFSRVMSKVSNGFFFFFLIWLPPISDSSSHDLSAGGVQPSASEMEKAPSLVLHCACA